MGFPSGSAVKESACSAGDLGLIPGLERSPGEGNGYPLLYSDLENSMDYSPWGCKELDTTEQLSVSLLLETQIRTGLSVIQASTVVLYLILPKGEINTTLRHIEGAKMTPG